VFIYTLVACRFESLSLPKQTTGKLLDYTGLYRRVPLLRRIHLFEIHDQTWFPGFLRDHLTEALQLIFEVGSLYIPIVGRLQKALKDAGAQRVLDLCSGAGGPWLWLHQLVGQEGYVPIDIWLTDRYPSARTFELERLDSRNRIHFHPAPVDATDAPADLNGFRTLFTAFHHFRPQEARAILQDAVKRREGIGIFEVPRRCFLTILLVFAMPLADLILAPFMRPFRWSRLIWNYLIPVIPIVLWFDGIVSCMRTYSPRELDELIAGLPANNYTWDIGEEKGTLFPVPVTYLIGFPNPTVTE